MRSWRRLLEQRLAGVADPGERLVARASSSKLRFGITDLTWSSSEGARARLPARRPAHWHDESLGLAVERPGVILEPIGATRVELELGLEETVIVISIEDLLVDRVGSWEATGSYADFEQAVMLDRHPLTNRDRLQQRADALDLSEPLAVLRWLCEEQLAGRMTDESPVCSRAHEGDRLGGLERAKRSVDEYRAHPMDDESAL
jgi:hypothetical protein